MAFSINNMREDAIRRAREMYSRATYPKEEPTPVNDDVQTTAPEPKTESPSDLTQDFLGSFFKDKEKMLILALLVILSQEEENNSLLFALMYLLI